MPGRNDVRTELTRVRGVDADQRRSDREERIFEHARSIPEGFVTTYGDLCPEAPRHAGAVMAACDDPDVPWHRVVRADGSLAVGERQRAKLNAEGVPFRGDRVDLRVAWFPVER